MPGGRRAHSFFRSSDRIGEIQRFWKAMWKNISQASKMFIPFLSTNPSLGNFPREINQQKKKKLWCIKIYTIKEWKHPEVPNIGQWLSKLLYT